MPANLTDSPSSTAAVPKRLSFAALRHADFRTYFVCSAAAMMADNIEHVISYWVVFQKFKSPALGGFAVISHWVPYLLFAAYTGALADRFDIRRLIQLGMLLFMGVSVAWGLLFLSGVLEMWHAMVLLVIHGLAGVFWLPAAQVLIHDMVDPATLPSAVRLVATGRYLGFLLGPAIGAGMLLAFGPAYGIFLNAAIYLPMFLWLTRAPYGSKTRSPPRRGSVRGFADILATLRRVAENPTLLSMTLLAGAASFFIGNAYQAQMPGFATDLGHGRADFSYSMLLGADAAGALLAGLILESRGLLQPKPGTAFMLAMVWCCALAAFALSGSYALALAMLFVAGFVELSFNAMAQTLVQLNAPDDIRGRVIGVFSMSSMGMRTFSGLSVGLTGAALGIHHSLALSAVALLIVCGVLLLWYRRPLC